MKNDQLIAHMKTAYNYANLSKAKRKKVGCVVVKNNNIIAIGYNGTLPGECNICEDENGHTLASVIHAEANALDKLAATSGGAENATVFVTVSPCEQCAVRLANVRIKELYYGELYRDTKGIELLKSRNISVSHLPQATK